MFSCSAGRRAAARCSNTERFRGRLAAIREVSCVRLGSRLLVVNPPDEIRELNEGYPPNVEHEHVTTSFYVWNDTTWKRVRVRGQ